MHTIQLPASKSICNRVLILNALSYSPYEIGNLSSCDDTQVMLRIMESDSNHFDVGAAGTAMRFLTAFLAKTYGEWHLTGSVRMQQRPIKVLVEALKQMGANITYDGEEGYPPLRIVGCALQGGEIRLNGSISSQYISALMMIAPYTEQGLTLVLEGEIVSKSYIQMTAALMREFGVQVALEFPRIAIKPQEYRPVPYVVESDWSAASYWYEWLCIAGVGEFTLPHLYRESLQGDSALAEIFAPLGVKTTYVDNKVIISATQKQVERFSYNFVNQPDIAQSVAVACCMRNIPFSFKGLETLRIKETDRIFALITELKKLGYLLHEEGEGTLLWDGKTTQAEERPIVATYEDHRMAMAFAPAKLLFPNLTIANPEVVSKSYPTFWQELKKVEQL